MIFRILFIVLFFAFSAQAATIRVNGSTGANDVDCGADGDECLTITYAFETRASAGDTVYIEAGTYYERINVDKDGSSGNVITIEGESESTAIIDGSDAVTAGNWSLYQNNVYQQTSYAYEPGSMYVVVNGNTIDIPRCRGATCSTAIETSSSQTETVLGMTINWWDGVEAMFRHSGTTLYVRFGDDSDPGSKTIRTSPEDGAAINLTNDSYITVKNLTVRGAHRGILCSGAGSNNIIIDNVTVYATGRDKIRVESSAHTVTIKNSELYGNAAWLLGSYSPGAWSYYSGSDTTYAVRDWIYDQYKSPLSNVGASGTEEYGIHVYEAGDDVDIHDNVIHDTLMGISVGRSLGNRTDIYNNYVYNISSVGLYCPVDGKQNIYNNQTENVNVSTRVQQMHNDSTGRECHYYNNRFWNEGGIGTHMHFHCSATPSPLPELRIYNNSYSGAYACISNDNAHTHGQMLDTEFYNNIFSCDDRFCVNNATWCRGDTGSGVGEFDNNWIGNNNYGLPGWAGTGNIVDDNSWVWGSGATSKPDFILPDAHATIDAGKDVRENPPNLSWDLNVWDDDMGWIDQITVRGHAVGIHN